ncbi:FAD-dependent oxidoreductase [Streptomyces olivaceus]|uniref:FAD-dependent oxidoreductase n=1 Tax=Streptomyces olivaceus TaxID=47716 RepID=UPI001CCC540F|nr:FAD-dependent oxidoreductase [Streptomyces olivaceus]MBZ6309546.1 tryptophan 7-halogenase [Streptomyces olivaceus]MBZ6323331.1 tryptophan 7-halogenase [Streptomyces olivaceus]
MTSTGDSASAESFDVIVVGGGPAGSSAATFVALQGHRVLLLEKESFPRHQIGESLLPSTVHGICALLGVSEELHSAGFVKKHGGTFRWGSNTEPWTFDFALSEKFAGPTSYAYQVERMKFDQLLLDNARRKGVVVRERCAVRDVLEDGGRVNGVRYTDEDGTERETRARFVVDASGNQSRLQGRVGGERRYSEFFQNIALYGYFEGGKRPPAPNSGNITCVAFDSGWFWYIPLSDTLTSVGAVVRKECAERIRGDRGEALAEMIADCPLVSDYLSEAERVTSGPYGEVRVRKDYSYLHDGFWRPGLTLVGDAVGFIDPLFSSGVHMATFSALLAARSINSVLRGDLEEEECFAEYEARYRKEYQTFHDFLVSFYDVTRDEQQYFDDARRVTRDSAPGAGAFVGLVGGGASDDTALTSDDYRDQRKKDLRQQSRDVHWEGHRIQMQAAFGEADDDVPAVKDGLVVAQDGMHWTKSADSAAV